MILIAGWRKLSSQPEVYRHTTYPAQTMRLSPITTRRLMLAVAIIALALSPGVIGPGPDGSNAVHWAVAMAVTNTPPILIIPFLFRLGRSRRLLVIVASAGITIAQLILRVPPNLYAVDSYMAIAGIGALPGMTVISSRPSLQSPAESSSVWRAVTTRASRSAPSLHFWRGSSSGWDFISAGEGGSRARR